MNQKMNPIGSNSLITSTTTVLLVFLTTCVKESWEAQTKFVVNNRPIIGVLAQEVYENGDYEAPPSTSYIAASYVKFLEGAGARVVPILLNQNITYLENLFGKINGVLFPGGAVDFPSSQKVGGYFSVGKTILEMAKKANDAGKFFPVWGTCLGFEFMIYVEAGQELRTSCKAQNVSDKLKFTQDADKSRLFRKAPKSIVNTLATKDVTVNFHSYCVTPENFTRFKLDESYKSLSVNYDSSSKLTYVSSIEHRRYPFYGVQFHPEKNIYEWTTKEQIPHSPEAVRSAQYFAEFFVDQARANSHSFPTEEEENRYLIYNYSPKFTGSEGATFTQKYYFNLSEKSVEFLRDRV